MGYAATNDLFLKKSSLKTTVFIMTDKLHIAGAMEMMLTDMGQHLSLKSVLWDELVSSRIFCFTPVIPQNNTQVRSMTNLWYHSLHVTRTWRILQINLNV